MQVVKKSIREMWSLEYEIADIQQEFNKSCLAQLDINSLTDDIVEDIMLQSKPLQVILLEIRNRQKVSLRVASQPASWPRGRTLWPCGLVAS